MLKRIISLLDPKEVLPSLRLTCKTFEVAAYERFVSAFVQERYHCIFCQESWANLERLLDSDSPFTARLQSVVLTTNCLGQADSQDIQLAPIQSEGSIEGAQLQACIAHVLSESKSLKRRAVFPDERYIKSILFVLKERYPRVLIKYDLFRNQRTEFDDLATQRAFFSGGLVRRKPNPSSHNLAALRQGCGGSSSRLGTKAAVFFILCVFRFRNSTDGDIKPDFVSTKSSGFVETALMCATQLRSLELSFAG